MHHPSFSIKEALLLLVCVLASAGCWYHGTPVNNTLKAKELLSDEVILFNERTSCSKLATSASEGETRGFSSSPADKTDEIIKKGWYQISLSGNHRCVTFKF